VFDLEKKFGPAVILFTVLNLNLVCFLTAVGHRRSLCALFIQWLSADNLSLWTPYTPSTTAAVN